MARYIDEARYDDGFGRIDQQESFDQGIISRAPAPTPGASSITGQVELEAFGADQNDLALGEGHSFLLSTDGVARTITGFAGVSPGRIVYLHNVAGGANISLANQSGSSTTEYRTITGTGGTVAIQPDRSAIILYDGKNSRWRLIAFT